jgi:hypothetical protein
MDRWAMLFCIHFIIVSFFGSAAGAEWGHEAWLRGNGAWLAMLPLGLHSPAVAEAA